MSKQKKTSSSTHKGKQIPSASIQSALRQAETLLDNENPQEAIDLLKPLVSRQPGSAELQTMLGSSYVQAGELWNAVSHYEKAHSLRRDESLLIALGYLYLELELNVLALRAFRQALKYRPSEMRAKRLREDIEQLEDQLIGMALMLDLPPELAIKGLGSFEEGQIALHNSAFSSSISLNRKAIRLLGDFPAPYNNLSQALFSHGQPNEAIRTARWVAEHHPNNIQALGNLTRFLAWTGQTEAAHQVWDQLKPLVPQEYTTLMKKVEAAAIMKDDEEVYRLLTEKVKEEKQDQEITLREQLYLAVAEANLGHHNPAKRRLKDLQERVPWAGEILKALQARKPGLGWADRFPYFHASELLPQKELIALFALIERQDKMPAARFRREIKRYATRFPQLVLMGKKTLLEDQQIEAAVVFLTALGTPEAYAVLREFGLSQSGDDGIRMQALSALADAGQFSEDETIRFWQNGEWRNLRLKKMEITGEREPAYTLRVHELLDEALEDFHENRLSEAEKKYKSILILEPNAKEAYNNLATIYARQDKRDRARELFFEAIKLDPLYVLPRCNLAIFSLDEDNVEEAEAIIAPLIDVSQLNQHEMAFLSYIRARIAIEHENYDQALSTLKIALQVHPDFKQAKDLLNHLEFSKTVEKSWERFFEKQRKQNLAKRKRQRLMLTTPDPTLAEALGIYSKDILTSIARLVIPWGGWSAYKKAQLHQYLVEHLKEPESFVLVLAQLSPEEKAAFDFVLQKGGTAAWSVFAKKFGDDMDESPHWQYHEPETVMGRLRAHGLLVEVTVGGKLLISIPAELRELARGK
jgi:Flp pilus assembly protein TadD